MSDFYKQIKKLISKDYKNYGLQDRFAFYSFRALMIGTVYFYVSSKSLIYLVASFLCYFVSKYYDNRRIMNKLNIARKFIEDQNIKIEIIEMLIDEIEKYNNKIKTFATWVAGFGATFIVLLINIFLNYAFKLFDVFTKVTTNEELLNFFGSEMESFDDMLTSFFKIALIALLFFLLCILFIYYCISIFTLAGKEQVLLFLYDVRYEIFLSGKHKECKIEKTLAEENLKEINNI